jgi:hypothetical protein
MGEKDIKLSPLHKLLEEAEMEFDDLLINIRTLKDAKTLILIIKLLKFKRSMWQWILHSLIGDEGE